MNAEEFKAVYSASRNGCNYFVRHWFKQRFQFSDGVQACAALGIYWLLDMLAMEMNMPNSHSLGVLTVRVANSKADLSLSLANDAPAHWTKHVAFTDMPDGEWIFFICNEEGVVKMILPSEY